MKQVILIYLFCIANLIGKTQAFSEYDIKQLASKVDQEIRGLDMGYGIVAQSCIAINRTLLYRYDVPENWYPPEDIKEEIISNLRTAGVANSYYKHNINADFLYYKGNSLIKRVSIPSNEFSTLDFELGEYVSIKNHPKAKGVDLKLKAPLNWDIKEGDRPNIVIKFVYETNTYLVLVRDNVTFFSRKEARELFSDDNYIKELIIESSSFLQNPEIREHKIVTLDTYPALEYIVTGKKEFSGVTIRLAMKCWMIYYEDKIVFLQGAGEDNINFNALEGLYTLITASIIFPEQYD